MCCANIDLKAIKNNYFNLLGDNVILKFKVSEDIGLGHLSRMITLASFLQEKGAKVFCAINNFHYAEQRLKEENIDFVVNPFDSDEKFIDNLIDNYSSKTILIDEKYGYKCEDIKRWKKKIRFISLDFIGKDYELCDAIVVPNAHFQAEKYSEFKKIFWGWDWLLINKEVLKLKPKEKIPEQINSIIITTGGSDPKGMLFKILDKIKNTNKEVLILVGDSFKHQKKLKNLNLPKNFKFEPFHPIKLLKGDIAISTFGISVYELIYLNIPVYCIGHNEENEKGCEILTKRCKFVKKLRGSIWI